MDSKIKDEWAQMLADAADRIADARKQLDRDDLEECHSYVAYAFDLVREVDHQLGIRDIDDEGRALWARTWFHEATLFSAFADALSQEPFMVDGTYKWRVRKIKKPPLKMPNDEPHHRDGPRGEIEVACNTAMVTFMIGFDSTHNKHVQGSSS
jgi:hypothetical protein